MSGFVIYICIRPFHKLPQASFCKTNNESSDVVNCHVDIDNVAVFTHLENYYYVCGG